MTLQEKIAVMEYFEKGGEIERTDANRNEWFRCCQPSWDWASFKYREKPGPPKEIWVNEYPMSLYAYENMSHAVIASRGDCIRRAVKYREVIEG